MGAARRGGALPGRPGAEAVFVTSSSFEESPAQKSDWAPKGLTEATPASLHCAWGGLAEAAMQVRNANAATAGTAEPTAVANAVPLETPAVSAWPGSSLPSSTGNSLAP